MKKILFGILTFLGIGLSFCSAESYTETLLDTFSVSTSIITKDYSGYDIICLDLSSCDSNQVLFGFFYGSDAFDFLKGTTPGPKVCGLSNNLVIMTHFSSCDVSVYGITPINSSSDITVYYNNSQSNTTITCDGTQAIEIQGLSTITSTNTFTPYFNISYIDEDNQSLIESYSKDILYLENGQFKKTYTGNNDRILTVQGNNSENQFTGYTPVFDVTGQVSLDTGNVFTNFADNSLKVLLSNIPAYIQYITIGFILLFLFGFIRRFKKKR